MPGGGERNLRLPYTQAPEVLTDAVGRLADAYATLDATGSSRRDPATLDLIA